MKTTLRDYLAHHTKPTGLWHNLPAYFISLLKAYYGKNATAENDFGYDWVPKITSNHSFFEYLYDMADGKMEGMFMMGQNPAVAAANSRFQRTSLSKLKWLVVRDMVEIEAATFWRDSPEIERGELKTEEIETEVFFFPAAGHAEKEGAFTNTQRHAAVARESGRSAGRRALGSVVHASACFASDRESETIKRSARRTVARARLVVSGR